MLTYVMLTVYDDATPTSARVSPAADKEDFMYEPPSHGCGVAGPPSRDYSFRESGYGVAGTIGNRTKRLVKWPMQLTTQARLENTGAKAFVQLAHRLTRIARVTLRNPQSAVRNPKSVAAHGWASSFLSPVPGIIAFLTWLGIFAAQSLDWFRGTAS